MTTLTHDRLVAGLLAKGWQANGVGTFLRKLDKKHGLTEGWLFPRRPDAWRISRSASGRQYIEMAECDVHSVMDYDRLSDYAYLWGILDCEWSEDTNWDIGLWTVRPGETLFVDLATAEFCSMAAADSDARKARLRDNLANIFHKVSDVGVYPAEWLERNELPPVVAAQ